MADLATIQNKTSNNQTNPTGGSDDTGLNQFVAEGLPGNHKALLFLVSVKESVATRILAHLSSKQVGRLREASDTLAEVKPEEILAVHKEFVSIVHGGVPTSLKGSSAYLRRLAGQALGEGKVAELWDLPHGDMGPVASLSKLDTPTLMAILEREHPQTLAVIFSLFEPHRASDLVAQFPMEKQVEIIRRMSELKSVPEAVVEDIESQFATELESLGDRRHREINGQQAASQMLKRMESEFSDALLEQLSSANAQTAETLRKSLFTFEDLLRLDSRGFQGLLKEISTEQLTIALKSASEDLKEKVFGNMSGRAAAMLRDELEMMGPVRLSDVQEAQDGIVETTLSLEKEGKIHIARAGGADFV